MTALRLGSLFDGIGVFPLAAVRCGIEPVWASEIEKAPISITKRHFPDMAHLGDVTKLDGRNIPPVHIPMNYIQQSDNFIKGIQARMLTTIFKIHNGTRCTINELREVFLCPAFGFSFALDLPA